MKTKSTASLLSIWKKGKKRREENRKGFFFSSIGHRYFKLHSSFKLSDEIEKFYNNSNFTYNDFENFLNINIQNLSNEIKKLEETDPLTFKQLTDGRIDENCTAILEKNKINGSFVGIETAGDGNCLYRSFSTILFGNQDKFKLIKICSLFYMKNHSNLYENIVKKHHEFSSLASFLQYHMVIGQWGSEVNILSLAHILRRDVIVLSDNVNYRYGISKESKNMQPILIAHINRSHFVSLLKKTNEIQDDLIKNLKMCDYFKIDELILN